MEKVMKFLRDRGDIPVSTVEKSLGLPNGTINVRKGYITPKHIEVVRGYLMEYYGYSEEVVRLVGNEDNPELGHVSIIKVYNKGIVPGFRDNIFRYQDNENGLWKRVLDWHKVRDKESGTFVIQPNWQPKNDELHEDVFGEYYIANNGIKVYVSYKSKKGK